MIDPDGRQAVDGDDQKTTGSHLRGSEVAKGMLSHGAMSAQGGVTSVSRSQTGTQPQIPLANNVMELASNITERGARRTSFSASGAGAVGVGFEAIAIKTTRPWQSDRVGVYKVIGLGAFVGANANFRLFSWGDAEGTTDITMKGNPMGYAKLKIGGGLAVGIVVKFNDHGGGSLYVSTGGGLGGELIVRPPATLGWEKEL
ncbi:MULTISPECIES: hypothetical protein [unclassified Luteimonas]